ncbi:MAG: hypothetical protein ACRC1H_10980, partial [Caldilineaceae bacterium]
REPGRFDDARLFLHGWFWISFVLIYLPVDYQIHMLNGWQVPIAVLATLALYEAILPAVQRRWGATEWASGQRLALWSAGLLLLIVVPTNLYLFAWRFVDLGRHQAPYYLYKDEVAALAWLDANAAPEDVVFASLELGQYVPAHTGANAFLAHWAQTVDFFTKRSQVQAFYDGSLAPATEEENLAQFSVDWIVLGPNEAALGSRVAPPVGFHPQWTQGTVSILGREPTHATP